MSNINYVLDYVNSNFKKNLKDVILLSSMVAMIRSALVIHGGNVMSHGRFWDILLI